MVITLQVRFDDGSVEDAAGGFADRRSACRQAVALADTIGMAQIADAPVPRFVDGYIDDRLEFVLTVVPGGIRPRAASR